MTAAAPAPPSGPAGPAAAPAVPFGSARPAAGTTAHHERQYP